MNSITLKHQEGLQFLSDIPDNSVDLILTDPPYITSRDSGMDKWVDHVAKQDAPGSENVYGKSDFKDYQAGKGKWEKKGPKDLFKLAVENVKISCDKQEKSIQENKKLKPEEKEQRIEKIRDPKSIKKKVEHKFESFKNNFLKYGSIYGKKYAVTTNYGDWDSEFTVEKLNLFVNHFYRVLRDGGTCIVFFDLWKITNLKDMLENCLDRKRVAPKTKKENESEEEFNQRVQYATDNPIVLYGFSQIRLIEWIKTNPQPINSSVNYLTNCREIALLGIKKSKPTFNSKYDKGIYHHPLQGGKDRFHPTQKSLPLFEELIEKHSNEGDLVLDCFAGSATTAVAAKKTNRQFIGCEMDEEYYNKSIERINNVKI